MILKPANQKRAEYAAAALAEYERIKEYVEEDMESIVDDLLTDLHHFCDLHNIDFDGALNRAGSHYFDETVGGE